MLVVKEKETPGGEWVPQAIPYQTLIEVYNRLQSIPDADREVILSKPPGADRKADGQWRRVCKKYNVATKASGKSKDKPQYLKEYALKRRVAALESRLKVREADPVWKLGPLHKVISRGKSSVADDVNVRQWFVLHMCSDCLRRMYQRIDPNPFNVCEPCRERLQSMLEVVPEGPSQ